MASEETRERSTRSVEVTVISVTVTGPPRGRSRLARERLTRRGMPHAARAVVATGVVVALLAAILVAALHVGKPTRSTETNRAERVSSGERAEIAGALGYPYPPRCLTITISADSPDFARADVDRTNGCGRYRGYINASLHRVDGAWRLALDEGQLFVPNSLLSPCRSADGDCARPPA